MAEAKAYKMIPHCAKDEVAYEMTELVLCKHCKYWKENTQFCERLSEGFIKHRTPPEWFCGDGEVKVEAWMPLPEPYKKDGDICVGDEVVFRKEHDDSDDSKYVVTHIDDDGYIQGIAQDGSAFISKGPCWQKTGKRYPIVMDLMNELQRVQR